MLVNREKLLSSLLSIKEESSGILLLVRSNDIAICTQRTIVNYYAAAQTIDVQKSLKIDVAVTLLNIVNTNDDRVNFERLIKILKLLTADNINIDIAIVDNIAKFSTSQSKLNASYNLEFSTEEILQNINYKRKQTLPLFTFTQATYDVLNKCKNALGRDEYKQKEMQYYVYNNTIYATNGSAIINAKFDCSHIGVLTLCSELCNTKFIGCKVFQIDNALHIVSESAIYVLHNNQDEEYLNFFNQVKSLFSSHKATIYNEIDIQAIRVISTIASYENSNNLLLNVSSKGKFEFYESESWLGLSGELCSEYSRSEDDKELQYCINAKLLLSYLDLLNFSNDEVAVFEMFKQSEKDDRLYITTKNLDYSLLFIASLKVDTILEQQELYKNREANFPKSGWSSWREYQRNNYKSVKEVEFSKKYEELKEKYRQAINLLVPANVEEIKRVQDANSKLETIKEKFIILNNKVCSEFDLSEEGQKLILLYHQLKALKKLEESEENTLLSQDLQINIDLLKKSRKQFITKELADLTKQAKELQAIVSKNPNLVEANIEQLANSNSHILAEKEKIESEYQDFINNPAKYINIP